MEISLTSKLQIMFQSETDRKSAYDTMTAYRDACNFVSQYIFDHDFVLKQSEYNRLFIMSFVNVSV